MVTTNDVERMLRDMESYESNTMVNNVKQRLAKNLDLYLSLLKSSYEYSISKAGCKSIVKELSKGENKHN